MRLKRMMVSPQLLMFMGSGVFRVIRSALPTDAQLRQTTIDPVSGMIQLFVESVEFNDIAFGDPVPELDAPVISKADTQDA